MNIPLQRRWFVLAALLLALLLIPGSGLAAEAPQLTCAGVSQIPAAECTALETLYANTTGAQWKEKTGWTITTTPCSWYGVTCQAGHVTGLDLSDNNLVGTLPTQLGDLPQLQTLNLARNTLNGALPAGLTNLTRLQVLDLSENQLSGALPAQIGALTALQTLNLSNNALTGSLPAGLTSLAQLRRLDLSTNQLTGPLPASLGSMSALQRLALNHNQFSGTVPAQLGNMTSLEWLILADNALSGTIPPQLGNLNQLIYLVLTGNDLSGSIPSALGNLSQLTFLMLNRNRLTGTIPAELGNLTNLSEAWLDSNALTGAIPASLCNLAGFYFLDTGFNALSSAPACMDFLDPQWDQTQTVAPAGLAATPASASATLTWSPIVYQSDAGGYEISFRPAGGAWVVAGQTADKTASSFELTGLASNASYEVRVRSLTAAHLEPPAYQKNDVWSEYVTTSVHTLPGSTPRRFFLPIASRH